MSKFEDYQANTARQDGAPRRHPADDAAYARTPSSNGAIAPHEELSYAFNDVARDHGNRCVIITGTGDAFCAEV